MRRAAVIALLIVAGAAQAAGPIVRVSIAGKSPHLVGQQVRVDVEVLVPNYFMSSVEIPSMTIPGAVVSMPGGGAENLSETIGGTKYAGIRRSFTIVPMQEGEFTLPPAKVTFRYAAEPGKAVPASLALPPKSFKAVLPPGASAAGGPALVARVTVKQALDREPKDIKAGDTLTRTVDIYASNTQSMVIPPTQFVAPDGVRVYPRDPQLTDVTDERGAFVGGRRIDRASYLFEKAGDYVLPEIDVAWFDAATGKRANAVAPALKVSVAPKPAAAPVIATEAEPQAPPPKQPLPWRRWLAWLALALLVILGTLLLLRYLLPKVRRRFVLRRTARTESEATCFARLERACKTNDAAAAYRALLAWHVRAPEIPLAGPLQDEVARLETSLFATRGERAAWSGAGLSGELAKARANRVGHEPGRRTQALPALNP